MAVQKPTETTETGPGGSERTKLSHPAFGQISVSRVSASPGVNLYGSDHAHGHFLLIEVSKSELSHSTNRDNYFPREIVTKLALSEAQWAAFVSSPNVGSGVACTLEFTQELGHLPQLPGRDSAKINRREILENLRSTIELLTTLRDTMTRLGPKMPAAVRTELQGQVDKVRQHVADNMPYALEVFDEQMEKSVAKARAEVDGYVLSQLIRAGLESNRDRLLTAQSQDAEPTATLPAPEET